MPHLRERSRRLLVISVDPSSVMALMGNWRHSPNLCLPVMTEAAELRDGTQVKIPDDYVIEGIQLDEFLSRRIELLISHPSFPEVPDGAIPPRAALMNVMVRISREIPHEELMAEFENKTVEPTATVTSETDGSRERILHYRPLASNG